VVRTPDTEEEESGEGDEQLTVNRQPSAANCSG
jgi:hypothetical protein